MPVRCPFPFNIWQLPTQHNTTQHNTTHNATQHTPHHHTTPHHTTHHTTPHHTTPHHTTPHHTTPHHTTPQQWMQENPLFLVNHNWEFKCCKNYYVDFRECGVLQRSTIYPISYQIIIEKCTIQEKRET
jgi:hypothetical protein